MSMVDVEELMFHSIWHTRCLHGVHLLLDCTTQITHFVLVRGEVLHEHGFQVRSPWQSHRSGHSDMGGEWKLKGFKYGGSWINQGQPKENIYESMGIRPQAGYQIPDLLLDYGWVIERNGPNDQKVLKLIALIIFESSLNNKLYHQCNWLVAIIDMPEMSLPLAMPFQMSTFASFGGLIKPLHPIVVGNDYCFN